MMIICKEYPKRTRSRFVIYIAAKNVDEHVINVLSIRSRYNPELHYYLTRIDEGANDEHVLIAAKQRRMLKEPYFTRI